MASSTAVSRLGEGDGEGGAPRGRSRPMPIHGVDYPLVFVALVAMSAVSVYVSIKRFDDWQSTLGTIVGIAVAQAALLGWYFMHLKFEGRLITLALFFPMVLCSILTAALIPDVGLGRRTSMSDPVAPYDRPSAGPGPGQPTPKSDSTNAERAAEGGHAAVAPASAPTTVPTP